MVAPSTIKFYPDHFVCGDSYRCVWALKEYPPSTTDQAILSRFGDKEAVTLHLYSRFVDGLEQRKILQNASRKNKMLASSNDLEDAVVGEGNLGDVVELISVEQVLSEQNNPPSDRPHDIPEGAKLHNAPRPEELP